MRNTFGRTVLITLFGESRGPAIGAVADGLPAGLTVDRALIEKRLLLRHGEKDLGTARREPDRFRILSGEKDGRTTGAPLTVLIENEDTGKAEEALPFRPSHADYTAYCRYHGQNDPAGGGHFSGRLTAPLVALGAIAETALAGRGITLATHILSLGGISDRPFSPVSPQNDIATVSEMPFAVLSPDAAEKMRSRIKQVKEAGDSVGGVTETVVCGMPAGVGEPFFDTLEGVISQAVFAVPAVKAVAFGDGFALADQMGSRTNDALMTDGTSVTLKTNHMGGIDGGLSNGAPIRFTAAVKPTPSIALPQQTVDIKAMTNLMTATAGRNDPAVIARLSPVISAVTGLALLDMLCLRYGQDWFIR